MALTNDWVANAALDIWMGMVLCAYTTVDDIKLVIARHAPPSADVLMKAIREHRDVRGDDRCHEDDTALYQVLPEGYTPLKHDSAVTLENCKRFIACRQNPATEYVSPEREIERLKALLAETRREHVTGDEEHCPRTFDGDMTDVCTCGADDWNAKLDEILT